MTNKPKQKNKRGKYIDFLYNLFLYSSRGMDEKKWFAFLLWFRDVFVHPKSKGKARNIKFKNRNQYQREYYHMVKKNDANYRFRNSFSSLLRHHIKKHNVSIDDILEKNLGYDIDALRDHIEKQFNDGMMWENYGKWHIDHIIPASMFRYSSFHDKEFKECWALENLRPLWAKDNLQKSNRLIYGTTN